MPKPPRSIDAEMPRQQQLIKCGWCGGGMSSNGADRKGVRIQCPTYKESGSCTNSRPVYLDDIEALVIKGLRQHLAHPEVITGYVDAYNKERKRLKNEASTEPNRIDRRLAEIEREIKRIVDYVTRGMATEALIPRMNELEAERKTLVTRLEEATETDNVIALHPKALDRYKRAIRELADEFKRGTPTEFATIRELVTAIVITPGQAGRAALAARRTLRMTEP